MSGKFGIEFDQDKAARLLSYVEKIDKGAEKALFRALKATVKKSKTQASTLIRKGNAGAKGLALKKAYVDSKLKTSNPSYRSMSARLWASRRGVLMSRYRYTALKRGGVNVTISPGHRKRLSGAFVLPRLKNSGVPGIAIREDGKLKVLHSPSVPQALNTHLSTLKDTMSGYADEQLEKQVSGVLRQAGF